MRVKGSGEFSGLTGNPLTYRSQHLVVQLHANRRALQLRFSADTERMCVIKTNPNRLNISVRAAVLRRMQNKLILAIACVGTFTAWGCGQLDERTESSTPGAAAFPAEHGRPVSQFDAEVLLFAAKSDVSSSLELFSVRSDGSNRMQLTNTSDHEEFYPRWSPDHSKIAYVRDTELWVMDHDGANEHIVSPGVGPFISPPSWGPDGVEIVFSWTKQPADETPADETDADPDKATKDVRLFTVKADGSAPPQQYVGKGMLEPVWLPSGEIAAISACMGEHCAMPFWMEGMGCTQTAAHGVTFTRDESKIFYADFFSSVRAQRPSYDPWIYQQSAPIVSCPTACGVSLDCTTVVEETDTWLPRLSPDEDRIAYLRRDGIWVKRLAAGAPERILQVTAGRGLDW